MAWAGKPSGKQKSAASIKSRRHPKPLPPPPDPERDVLKQLAREQLPPTKEAYQARYNELIAAQKAEE